MPGYAVNLLPLLVLRERAGVRVISSTNEHRKSKSPSPQPPQPSLGLPGEGAAESPSPGSQQRDRLAQIQSALIQTASDDDSPERQVL